MTKNMKHAEHILAVSSETVKSLDLQEGFQSIYVDDWVGKVLPTLEEGLFIAPRKLLEVNENYRQILPYNLIMYPTPDCELRFLTYRRAKGVGEGRLLGKASIGVGGHVDIADCGYYPDHKSVVSLRDTLARATDRELHEELGNGVHHDGLYFEGLLTDNSDAVGRVHLGVIYSAMLHEPVTGLAEPELEFVGMLTLKELRESDLDFENWSKILIESDLLERIYNEHR